MPDPAPPSPDAEPTATAGASARARRKRSTGLVLPRLAWALTGSGHYFTETLELVAAAGEVDLFVSKAAAEVVSMYKQRLDTLPPTVRVIKDSTASAAPIGRFYYGDYHTAIIGPATSNTVAKCVYGISDTLATNVFAHAGKCRVPTIVFACDTAPEMDTMAPKGMVKVYPRRVDLDNVERLRSFEDTEVVETLDELTAALRRRKLV
jgi:dihydromethanopterin reductase (acceptor)